MKAENHSVIDKAKHSSLIFKILTAVVSLLCFIVTFILLFYQKTKTVENTEITDWSDLKFSFLLLFFPGVATSLLASLTFSILYSRVTEKMQVEVMGAKLSQTIQEINDKHVPIETFPASKDPHLSFGRAIEDGLANSNTFRIKTVRGNFLNTWLSEKWRVDQHPHLIMVLLLNPKKVDKFFDFIQGFSSRHDSGPAEIKQDIYNTVKKLFEHRKKTRIQIKIYEDTIFYRSEIFEDFALVSYSEKQNHGMKFPPSYQYGRKSIDYRAISADFEQTWSLNECFEEFNSTTKKEKLDEFLLKIGYDDFIKEQSTVTNNKSPENNNNQAMEAMATTQSAVTINEVSEENNKPETVDYTTIIAGAVTINEVSEENNKQSE